MSLQWTKEEQKENQGSVGLSQGRKYLEEGVANNAKCC